MERKDLKIYEKDGGPLKDSIKCDVTHVVTKLRPELRADYKQFFQKPAYQDIKVVQP